MLSNLWTIPQELCSASSLQIRSCKLPSVRGIQALEASQHLCSPGSRARVLLSVGTDSVTKSLYPNLEQSEGAFYSSLHYYRDTTHHCASVCFTCEVGVQIFATSISLAYLRCAASLLGYLMSVWIQGRHNHNPCSVNQLHKKEKQYIKCN